MPLATSGTTAASGLRSSLSSRLSSSSSSSSPLDDEIDGELEGDDPKAKALLSDAPDEKSGISELELLDEQPLESPSPFLLLDDADPAYPPSVPLPDEELLP